MSVALPSPDYVREFVDSLPASYAARFDARARESHAAVAHRRGARPVAVGVFHDERTGSAALCVVANDRPGLLATMSAALVIQELDVMAAEAFTRKTPTGQAEAVDVFWVQRRVSAGGSATVDEGCVTGLQDTLTEMLQEVRPRSISPSSPSPAPATTTETVVRFLEDADGALSTLEVETDDRSGLLLSLSRALFDQRVQIVASEVRTTGHRVFDRFSVVELDNSPIAPSRRLQIQVAVLAAIEVTRP